MVRSSFSILFAIRESKARKSGKAPIEITITVNGDRCSFSSGKQVAIEKWDKNKQQVKGKDEEAQRLNNCLKAIKAKLYQKEAELLERGFIITADLLRDAYFDKVESIKERSLFEVFEEHNQEQEKLIGNGVSKATYWVSVYTIRLLREFVQQKYKREDLYLRELNLNFIQSFHSFLRIDKGMAQNSSTKHLKLLKKIINLSVANSYMAFNPFSTYKVEREPVEVDFLDEEELRKIIKTTDRIVLTLSRILCKWKQDSVVSLFLYLDSVFKNKHKLIYPPASHSYTMLICLNDLFACLGLTQTRKLLTNFSKNSFYLLPEPLRRGEFLTNYWNDTNINIRRQSR